LTISIRRKDGRSQRGALANNLAANAADMVKAVHGGHNDLLRACRQGLPQRPQTRARLRRRRGRVNQVLKVYRHSRHSAAKALFRKAGDIMRTPLLGLAAVLCIGLSTAAQAERRMFIIANDADGYGIDRCLASGAKCGAAAANAYCKTQAFGQAATYNKVDRDDITGAIPTGNSGGCRGPTCEDFVAIVCTR
jgi:hypothetical protein